MLVRLKLWALGIGLVIAAFAATWFGGRKSGQADIKIEGLEDYVETRKRMDDVGRLSDADAAAEWLRERGKR